MLDNLALLDQYNANIVLRCPIIPNINDTKEHFAMISTLAQTYSSIDHVEILPYHPMGKSKAKEIGALYTIKEEIPEDETVNEWITQIQSNGYQNVIKG